MSLLSSSSSYLGRIPTSLLLASGAAYVGFKAVFAINRILTSLALGNPLFASGNTWDAAKEIALVTGGNSGIGRQIVNDLAAEGVKVVALDLVLPSKENPYPNGVLFYQVDVTSEHDVRAAAESIRRDIGHPSVLVNNAGTGHGQTLLDAAPDDIRRVFAVNAIAPMLLIREFLPSMIAEKHGHIVNIASTASFVTIASNIDYSCTKASLMALHEGLTQELKHRYDDARNIRTTIVHPHWVRTPLIASLQGSLEKKRDLLDPEDVSRAVVKQVVSGCSGQVFVPGRLGILASFRAFPVWLQELIRDSAANILKAP